MMDWILVSAAIASKQYLGVATKRFLSGHAL